MNKQESTNPEPRTTGSTQQVSALELRSCDLFRNHDRVFIDHEGCQYVLSITRQGKLILTK
ncbi:MAG: hemin uptake protein HemP [Sedimenticola sp.]